MSLLSQQSCCTSPGAYWSPCARPEAKVAVGAPGWQMCFQLHGTGCFSFHTHLNLLGDFLRLFCIKLNKLIFSLGPCGWVALASSHGPQASCLIPGQGPCRACGSFPRRGQAGSSPSMFWLHIQVPLPPPPSCISNNKVKSLKYTNVYLQIGLWSGDW